VFEQISSFRRSNKVIITDERNLVYFPPNEEDERKFSEYVKRSLQASNIVDRKIIRRLIEKALDIGIRKVTGTLLPRFGYNKMLRGTINKSGYYIFLQVLIIYLKILGFLCHRDMNTSRFTIKS
jgi:hypothetical protein